MRSETSTSRRGVPAMTPSTASSPRARAAPGPVLLATDGTASANPAFTAARLISARTGADVRIVAVAESLPLVLPPAEIMAVPSAVAAADFDAELSARMRETVTVQRRERVGPGTEWPIDVRSGEPASVIARVAREHGSSIVVTGFSHHGLVDRMLGGETPINIVHLADTPVLVVTAAFERAPRCLVIATDFTPASTLAAHVALDLFDDASHVYLVHVTPRFERGLSQTPSWEPEYSRRVREALDRLRAEFPKGLDVQTVTLSGSTPQELIDFAEYVRADLLVAGSHRRGMFRRLLMGDVAAKLARGASTSLLLVPETARRPLARRGRGGQVTAASPHPAEWPAALAEFTRRNAGRRVVLEVHDMTLGAQAQVTEYPLLGVAYDPHDRRLEIMLGDAAAGARHLTHTIADPQSLDVVRGPGDRDSSLRIAQRDAQTLLLLNS